MLGDEAATADPTVEHIGQTCEVNGDDVRSVQKWNCAQTKKLTTRSKAKMRMRCFLPSMRY
jgi:hypothetical protein